MKWFYEDFFSLEKATVGGFSDTPDLTDDFKSLVTYETADIYGV